MHLIGSAIGITLDAGVIVQLLLAGVAAVWMVATMRGETRRLRNEIAHLRIAVDHLAGRRLDERVTRCETLLDVAGLGRPLHGADDDPRHEWDGDA